ncbi:hypothetical protein OIU79_024389, partial [Salix purpurea]
MAVFSKTRHPHNRDNRRELV